MGDGSDLLGCFVWLLGVGYACWMKAGGWKLVSIGNGVGLFGWLCMDLECGGKEAGVEEV